MFKAKFGNLYALTFFVTEFSFLERDKFSTLGNNHLPFDIVHIRFYVFILKY